MSDINIIETISDKNSLFNVKRFKLNGLDNDFSIKSVDLNNTNKNLIVNTKEFISNRLIFEKGKEIKNFEEIVNVIKEEDPQKINYFFGKKTWTEDSFNVFHSTLRFNPYNHVKKMEDIEGFWHYYYSYSKNILLIPNILKSRNPYIDGKKQPAEQIVSLQEYIKFVDELHTFFETMNNKPVFVPISLKFNMDEIKLLIEHYLKKEYYYLWIDFEATQVDPANSAIFGKIRQINSLLKQSGHFERCLIYATNIKREILSNPRNSLAPASDILTTLCGANIVGINKSKSRFFSGFLENSSERIKSHKARIFDKNSYYYQIVENSTVSKQQNITDNSFKLSIEFKNQKKSFLDSLDIREHLKNKKMIQQYQKGKILNSLKPKKIDSQMKLF